MPTPDPGYNAYLKQQQARADALGMPLSDYQAIANTSAEMLSTGAPMPYHKQQRVDPDAADPKDVAAIKNLNDSIHETIEHFATDEWFILGEQVTDIYLDWLRS